MEEISKPAQEGLDPETQSAREVAPRMRNGYRVCQPSLHLRRATVVRGAFGVHHQRVPLLHLFFFFPLLTTSSAPIMIGFVFPNPFYVFLGPKANLHASQSLRRRCLDPFLSNPAMECTRSNLKEPRHLNRRIGLHGYNGVPCTICHTKSHSRERTARALRAPP